MKMKIAMFGMLTLLGTPLSHAISIGSISDAISNKSSTTSSTNAPEITAPAASAATKSASAKKTSAAPQTEKALPNPALFIEDAAMTGYIHSQLLLKKNIPGVTVTTQNAVVSLSGMVDTQEQADTLVKIASSVKGVKAVNTDHLLVRNKAVG